MTPAAQITHQMEGRVRIRIPDQRRNAAYFGRVEESLRRCEGVDRVDTNPLAASILVTGLVTSGEVVKFAEQHDLFSIAPSATAAVPLSERVAARVDGLDGRVRRASGGQLDLNGLSMLGLGVAMLWQLSRRRVLPEALNILWYAASLVPRRVRS
jgi:hypothetical protein